MTDQAARALLQRFGLGADRTLADANALAPGTRSEDTHYAKTVRNL